MSTLEEELSMNETSIAPAASEDGPEESMDASSFDLAAWIQGVQATERATTLYSDLDLLAHLDLLKEQIVAAKTGRMYDQLRLLQDEARGIIQRLEDGALDVVVVGWSTDRIKAFRDSLKDKGLDEDDITVEQIAAQIKSPEGFTADMLRHLMEISEPQARKIIGIAIEASQGAPVVALPS